MRLSLGVHRDQVLSGPTGLDVAFILEKQWEVTQEY